MKREIYNFSKKICKNINKVQKVQTKFVRDMIYGILRAKDILLSSIADVLLEETKKQTLLID